MLCTQAEPWAPWFHAAGLEVREPQGALEFNDAGLMLQAAVARQGIALARSLMPAIVIMDLSMPDVDGWEATRLLKSDPATRRIGIVALSAFHEPESRRRAREAGADFFLAKPCLPSELALHVSECIRRTRRA